MTPTSAGFIAVAASSSSAILATIVGLLWAAVQDGRDERAFRRTR